jgi:glutathione peroxidase-family protein
MQACNKKIFGTAFMVLISVRLITGSIHDYQVPTIEGGTQSLSAYQNKKLLVITLPLSQDPAADSFLYSLDTLATAHANDLKVVAVPSFEDGFTIAGRPQLLQWYRSKLSQLVLITDGFYTRKSSGSLQHPLFKWMTDENMNEVFNIDVDGPGYKFFARGDGQLYSVLRPISKISGPSVQKTLNTQ